MTIEEEINARIKTVFETVGPEIVEDLQDDLSINYPPASKPGEYPHKRTGNLRAKVSHEITDDGSGTPILTVSSAALYAEYLEKGTPRMAPRPHAEPTQDKWEPIVYQRLQAAFPSPSSDTPSVPSDAQSIAGE